MKKNNSGFSLIELIIVIAIMAILIGIMVPVLISYIEKTNVSSDYQLADSVYHAFLYASTDAKVLADPESVPFFEDMESEEGLNVDCDTAFLNSHCVMKESVDEIIGKSVDTLIGDMKSAHADDTHINVKMVNNRIIVTLTGTDITGKKDTSSSTSDNDIKVE